MMNTRKRRAVNNRPVQDTHSSANEASDTENKANAEDYAKPKETLYHLLFECEDSELYVKTTRY